MSHERVSHKVIRPENLQLFSWELSLRTEIHGRVGRLCLVVANAGGGNDACGSDADNGCFQTGDTWRYNVLCHAQR